ncbi:MAG: molybdopterin molybdotransferase MoeA [Marinilabiliales bacterium]
MIQLSEALNIVLNNKRLLQTERINFRETLGRVLAEDIESDIFMPPFDKSAMDGFACRYEDIKNKLTIIETVQAGKKPEKKVGKNQCTRIMTGAMIPEGADCVLMVEQTKSVSENEIIFTGKDTKPNICYYGEDLKKGELVLKKGTLLKPQHIAVLAAIGATQPLVYKKPVIGILSTGNEIVEPSIKPGISQIRNSNSYQLEAQTIRAGALPHYMGIVKDTEEETYKAIEKGIKESDILLLTGGVSMGDFDFVPEVMKKAGIEILFKTIAVQPGKPTTFGRHKDALIFGLPGNPVSSFIQFELLVKPLIYHCMGYNFKPQEIKLPMDCDYNRKKTDRMSWFPVKISEKGTVVPVEYHGSAHIFALPNADALSYFPIGATTLKKGEYVHVRQI